MQNTNNINDEQNEILLPEAYDRDEIRKKVRIYSSRLRRIEEQKKARKRKLTFFGSCIIAALSLFIFGYIMIFALTFYAMFVGA